MERIYIVQGEGGLFKVGRTGNFPARLVSLRAEFKRRGDAVDRQHAFGDLRDGYLAEANMIKWLRQCATPAAGREWFTDVDFAAALVEGEKQTKATANWAPFGHDWTEQQKAEYAARLVVLHANSAQYKAERLRVCVAYDRMVAHRRLVRARSERAIAAMVEAIVGPDAAWEVLHLQTAPSGQQQAEA